MRTFTKQEIRSRAFLRLARVLYEFWEERKSDDADEKKNGVHSRIFDTLIRNDYIELNKKEKDRSYKEHIVPCAFIRTHAFEMFADDSTVEQVAHMIERLLKIVYISKEEAWKLNHELGYKATMPKSWDAETGSIYARLDAAGIKVSSAT